jgi:ABC-type cobalamin transport system permease subunit
MTVRPVPLLLAALALAVPLSLLAGQVWIDPLAPAARNALPILIELRLPRAVLALLVGGGLGAAGAAMQGYLRNPLADPGLFGIAPMAALGAVLSFWTGYAAQGWLLPLFALAGAALGMALLALIAGRTGGVALFTLAGMMIASLAGALTSLAISLAPNPFALSEIVTWLMGALADRGWPDVLIALPPTLLACWCCGAPGRRSMRSCWAKARRARLVSIRRGCCGGWSRAWASSSARGGGRRDHRLRRPGRAAPRPSFTDRRPSRCCCRARWPGRCCCWWLIACAASCRWRAANCALASRSA